MHCFLPFKHTFKLVLNVVWRFCQHILPDPSFVWGWLITSIFLFLVYKCQYIPKNANPGTICHHTLIVVHFIIVCRRKSKQLDAWRGEGRKLECQGMLNILIALHTLTPYCFPIAFNTYLPGCDRCTYI